MSVIFRSAHPSLYWPGVAGLFGHTYKEIPTQWTELFETRDSDKAEEQIAELTGFGLAPVKPEGANIVYQGDAEGYKSRFRIITYGLGWIATMEEIQDKKYEQVATFRSKGLAYSHRQTEEIVHANIFNRATNASYVGGDGRTLLDTQHPTRSGPQANRAAVDADFSEAGLEDLCIDIMNARNAAGLRINLMPEMVIVGPELKFVADRILKSRMRSGTANNDMNAVGEYLSKVMVYRYLEDDSWFIKTNCQQGLLHFERMALQLEQDNEFGTKNARASAIKRYAAGWGDWRCLYGSAGR